jgi:hypothetical protein
MKKLAIGCLIIVVVCCVIGAGAAYFVYRQVRSSVVQLTEFAKAEEIERGIRVREAYAAPANEELTQAQLDRYLRVQDAIRQRIGDHFTDFERRYKQLAAKKEANFSDLPELLKAYGEIASGWAEAKRSQVEALNAVEMSLSEYRWIRDQVYRAMGMTFVDLDFAKFAESARRGVAPSQPGQLRGALEPTGPEINRKLIEPYKKQFEQYLALASFGL